MVNICYSSGKLTILDTAALEVEYIIIFTVKKYSINMSD